MQSIKKANSISELNKIKENFLSECAKQEKIILVNEMLNNINDFVTAKVVFESLASNLLYKTEGKHLINNYTKIKSTEFSRFQCFLFFHFLLLVLSNSSKKPIFSSHHSLVGSLPAP